MSAVIEGIEEFFRRRYGREAMYLPSGRLGLYVAFREWLSPGNRVLMSPLTDDVVFFTVLAAGLVPVFGPVDPRTGNLDPNGVDDATWSSLHAVLTTNLYGIPDRMDLLEERCRRHGLVLLEDAAHALDSRVDGRRIGTFGSVAVYSLVKHLEVPGGVLVFPEADRRESLRRRTELELRDRPYPLATAYRALTVLFTVAGPSWSPPWLASLLQAKTIPLDMRPAHRIPYATGEVRDALAKGGGLDRFKRWVRTDHRGYRTPASRVLLRTSLHRLETFDENRRIRLDGARRLQDLGCTPDRILLPPDTALLRVPLFVEDRERVVAHLSRRGLATDYIYDPPLDVYADGFADSLPSPPSAAIWSRDVLPVNPLVAGRFLALLRKAPGLCRPIPEGIRPSGTRPPDSPANETSRAILRGAADRRS